MKFRLLLILVLSSFVVSGQTVEARLAVKKKKAAFTASAAGSAGHGN